MRSSSIRVVIADGTKVRWHGPATRQGRITYTGTVLGFVPAMASLIMWEARFVQRRQRAIFWASAKSSDQARTDRYVVETPQGCRTVSARGLEAAQ